MIKMNNIKLISTVFICKIRYNISQLYLDNFYKRELTEYYYQEKI